ncbi:hypothetical protein GGR50DRAFT_345302 [Xylaria sp. CBS 124048]|nr:hypothetical protein GGR50DRAFT_345302 [Xylaria sp. CBS 124048]
MTATMNGAEMHPKKVHPFFSPAALSKTNDAVTPPTPDPSCSPASTSDSEHEVPERKPKRQKRHSSAVAESRPPVTRKKSRARLSAGPGIAKHFGLGGIKDEEAQTEKVQDNELKRETSSHETNVVSAQASKPAKVTNHDSMADEEKGKAQPESDQKSRKILKFNPKTGTIGSPPKAKPSAALHTLTSARNGAKRGLEPQATIIIPYGNDAASRERIGRKIQEILLGISIFTPPASINATYAILPEPNLPNSELPTTTKQLVSPKTAAPKKPPHPFFQAKGKAVSSTENDQQKTKEDKAPLKRQTIFTSTPCPPRTVQPIPQSLSVKMSGSRSGGVKVPGAQHPAWPWRDIVHVRDSSSSGPRDKTSPESIVLRSRRKAKGQATRISQHESILCGTAPTLALRRIVSDLKSTHDEDFRPVSPSLVRVPTKHFESGRKLQARVSKELHTLKRKDGLPKTHPAILHAYHSLATTLSAFDRSTCESVAWTQKYAPTSAHCVLQTGREAMLLRDWLQSLQVQAVDTGASDGRYKSRSVSALNKKRKNKDLDGFVVSSDSEADDMHEVSDDGPQWLNLGARDEGKKTVLRYGDAVDRGGKLTNTALLSGPHGCGKTATVYAIAKELDFEVFEINAGARRSGKDILERVGDMTRNHLVHRQHKEEPQEDGASDDELANDLKSGKQGMMTSFFKFKTSQSTKTAKKANFTSEDQRPVSQEKKPNRDHKQSLILLEEVDILYEEDKQFWTTVISMIAQSKRPFIMTCNDESVVPLQNLKLHGIFRISSPPVDLAVDMLLLIAANEGHALQRQAVESLYVSRSHDFRAAITELEYWCQIGVGDLRGGFDWFYPRWPKGSDVDEKGDTIRVVSENTYQTGMGWFNRDLTATEPLWPPIIPQLHGEAWDHWALDVSDHHELSDASNWGKKLTEKAPSRTACLDLLRSVEAFADIISDSDICGPFLPPHSNHIMFDAAMPSLSAKTVGDFTIDRKLLEATPLYHYDSISLSVSTSLRVLAQSHLLASQKFPESASLDERFNEKHVAGHIEHHLKMSSQSEGPVTRRDYSLAFDPIAASEKTLANGYIDPSIFDREMTPICLDVAPYVRSIVAYDQRLQNERLKRSNLLSQGGKPDRKRMRTTRSAFSALEGGSRSTTRREKYFTADINPYLVMRTSGKGWTELAQQADE